MNTIIVMASIYAQTNKKPGFAQIYIANSAAIPAFAAVKAERSSAAEHPGTNRRDL